jgi:hypothetical protein
MVVFTKRVLCLPLYGPIIFDIEKQLTDVSEINVFGKNTSELNLLFLRRLMKSTVNIKNAKEIASQLVTISRLNHITNLLKFKLNFNIEWKKYLRRI